MAQVSESGFAKTLTSLRGVLVVDRNLKGREHVDPIEKFTRHQFEATSIARATASTTHNILADKMLFIRTMIPDDQGSLAV